MSVHTFTPFQGTDKISFGDGREEVRSRLGNSYKTFLRNQFADNTTDYYEEQGFFVEYDKEDICQAVEFTEGATLLYNGVNLFSLTYTELKTQCDTRSDNIEDDGAGITYHDLGFGSTPANEDDAIETIIIFSETYW